ncbi:MAG TPA: HAMP domain-containing sensor histidine kinase [Acidimicrobiia bacterium]|nr:HAMP domain-containing sensor histidine kinase [Acidimicrobiia bacterium]
MSLRVRLLAGMAVVAIVLVGASVLISNNARSALVSRVDAQLTSANIDITGAGFDGGPPQHFTNFYVGQVDSSGAVHTALTPGLGDGDRPLPKISSKQALAAFAQRHAHPFTVGSVSGGGHWRVIAASGPGGSHFFIALSLHDVSTSLSRIERVEIAVTAVILAILALVTWFVLHLGLRPIKKMTETATAIAVGDLSHRVPDVDPRTEAGELGAALNTMMTKIEDAFDQRTASEARLRQFVADASHELRTPVTTIRGYAELYRGGGLRDPDELTQAMRRTEQESIRMGSLVEDLLLLARLDQNPKLQEGAVDLGVLAVDAVADARAVDPERPITASVAEGVAVDGDEDRLRQVVANLVGNALVHTPPGTPVQVRVDRDDGQARLEVHDDGPGMPEPVSQRVFERFYRADPARSRHAGGSGLGLSIVKAIVEAHHGEVTIASAPGEGTTARVTLPLIADSGPDPTTHSVRSGS